MPDNDNDKPHHTGLYERAVGATTDLVKPRLHKVTEDFVDKSVDKYAKDNPHYASMIEFEVRRRGDGAGLTQDVAEPAIWIGVKTAAALAIAAAAESVKNKTLKMVGWVSSLTIIANQMVEAFRLLPRYRAGLQGSLEMAKDRWKAIEETGVDPFSKQSGPKEQHGADAQQDEAGQKNFAHDGLKRGAVSPTTLSEQAEREPVKDRSP
ncbi:MAG TPA: hypothetical protein VFT64_06425 [Rickettsiales bacterium]|nr:hypothetical protein [Rickettsiales bacterium]